MWDLKSTKNDADTYAVIFCRDQQLPADLVPIISQSIRDQVKNARKCLVTGYGDAGVVKFAHAVRGMREMEKWTPQTKWLSANEKEVLERSKKKQRMKWEQQNQSKQRHSYVAAAVSQVGPHTDTLKLCHAPTLPLSILFSEASLATSQLLHSRPQVQQLHPQINSPDQAH